MDFLADDDGDIAVVNGDFVMVDGQDEIIQFLTESLRLFLGEWFLDETRGFPWHDKVFVKNPNFVEIDTVMKRYIATLPGVMELTSFSSAFDSPTRNWTVSGSIRTQTGNADFSVTNLLPGSI